MVASSSFHSYITSAWSISSMRKASFRKTTITKRYLNRFLFDPEGEEKIVFTTTITTDRINKTSVSCNNNNEDDTKEVRRIILPKDDYRTVHAAKILNLHNGDTIRAGLVREELWTDAATIQWLPEGKTKKAEPLGRGQNPPGSLQIDLHNLQSKNSSSAEGDNNNNSDDSLCVSLLLALPRPLQLGRMLPMISQLGVEHIVLTGASKVPKDYFGSHLFVKPYLITEKIIEGLCQSGDVRLPQIWIRKNLRDFIGSSEIDLLFPKDEYARVIAHPQRMDNNANGTNTNTKEETRMKDVKFPNGNGQRKILLAVGPEGGWEEPTELNRFQNNGFQQITLGTRTLRSDVAVISLLSLANEVCSE